MVELSFGELKLGLVCCTVNKDCKFCPLREIHGNEQSISCMQTLLSAAFNCINTMEADMTRLSELASSWEATCLKHENRIHELNGLLIAKTSLEE